LDAALRRRAAIVEEFTRPNATERKELFSMDLAGMGLSDKQLTDLATGTGERNGQPAWTYSDRQGGSGVCGQLFTRRASGARRPWPKARG